jgi:hypothetical protein
MYALCGVGAIYVTTCKPSPSCRWQDVLEKTCRAGAREQKAIDAWPGGRFLCIRVSVWTAGRGHELNCSMASMHALDAQCCERDSCHLYPHQSLIFSIHTPPLPGVVSESTADPVNLTGWYSFAVKCVGPPCTRSHCNCGSDLAKGNCNQGQSEEDCAVNVSKICQEFVPNPGAWCPHCSTLV